MSRVHAQTLTHLLYLHGFRSSPMSAKAQQTLQWFRTHYPDVTVQIPQLPPSPQAAAQLIAATVATWPHERMAVMGSSLGGYYASWVAAQYACPAVLLNPAVNPARDLARYIGQNTQWHRPEEAFYFKPEYIEQLRALDSRGMPCQAPQLVVIAKGDEVLDWREMAERHADAQCLILEGHDHALTHAFAEHLPQLATFLYTLGKGSG